MAVLKFHVKVTLDGRAFEPGQTAEIEDALVYPLIVQGVITALPQLEADAWKAGGGYEAPSPRATSRDPQPRRG